MRPEFCAVWPPLPLRMDAKRFDTDELSSPSSGCMPLASKISWYFLAESCDGCVPVPMPGLGCCCCHCDVFLMISSTFFALIWAAVSTACCLNLFC